MRLKELLLAVIAVVGISKFAFAQPTGVYSAEIVQVHYGEVGGVDLDGYITYQIFAHFTNEDDFLSAIYAVEPGQGFPPGAISIVDDCNCFNDDTFGGFTAQVNEALCPSFPAACYDTFWTIGKEYSSDPGEVYMATTIPATPIVEAAGPCGVEIVDGAVFTVAGSPNGVAGPDLKVLIAQITTCAGLGGIEMDFCLQVFVNGDQDNQAFDCPEDLVFENPCLANPVDTDITVVEELLCAGETATVTIGGGGNSPVDYSLYEIDGLDSNLVTSQVDDLIFDDLGAGEYYVAITDTYGCLDTAQAFTIVEPDELEVTIDFTQDNDCFGDAMAELCPTITGGIEPYLIEAIGPDGTVTEINDGECFSNLGCVNGQGNYTVTVTDQNGCSYTEDFDIACPEAIEVDATTFPILCNGDASGSIDLTITGGTGDLTITFTDPDFTTIVQPAPLNILIEDIDPGIHTLDIVDANGCTYTQDFDLQEPDPLESTFVPTDVLCFGDCTGTISNVASGGTSPYTLTVFDADGIQQDPTALCEGEYTATTTDANGCEVSETVIIGQPDEITYTLTQNDLSCFGAGDGEICIADVTGGTGQVQWQITSPPPASTPLGTEPCLSGLEAETYAMAFTDEAGCTVSQNGIELIEPGELILTTQVMDVTCNGLGDGMVVVTAEGGTGEVNLIAPENFLVPDTVMNLVPNDYEIIIEDESGCQDSEFITIAQPDSVQIEVLSVSNISCGGDCDGSIEVEMTGGVGELSLLLNGTPAVPTGICAGEYEAVVIDENFCTDTTSFEIVQPDPIEFLINIDPVTCTGMNDGSVIIFPEGGEGPITYEIFGEDEEEEVNINNLFEGAYTVIGQDSTGCVADTTFIVPADIETDMAVTIFTSPVTCWNEADGTATAAVTGGQLPISYQWDDQAMQTTATAVGLPEEVYMVTVTDAIGCTLSFFAEVEPTEGCFFIADAITPNGDGANDEWVIGGLEYFPTSTVQVYNGWGQLLYESQGYNTPWDGTYNGNELPTGDYYYVITYDSSAEPITGTVTLLY